MKDKESMSTLDIDYEAPFRIMLEKYLPGTFTKLLIENGNIVQAIDNAIKKQRRRKGN